MALRRDIVGFMLEETLTLGNFKIVEYFPYTSIVTLRVVNTNPNYETPFDEWLNSLWKEIEKWLEKEKGIMPDNKVAVKLVVKPEVYANREQSNDFLDGCIYVGRKDGVVSIGFGVWQPDDWTKKYNKEF
jgi:hypothetical protein